MQVIIISSKNSTHKHFHLSVKYLTLFLTILVAAAIALILFSNTNELKPSQDAIPTLPQFISSNTSVQEDYSQNNYYAKRIGQLQAESIRLSALAEKMAEESGVDLSAFDLSEQPGQGGLENEGRPLSTEELHQDLDALDISFKSQNERISLLEDLYLVRQNITSAIPQGYPVKEGWISSGYGYRTDPFNGKKTMHKGLDFAGKEGGDVLVVADGIVSWTGRRSGYGKMIDIDHGNGYISRYAHNKKLLVSVGMRVKKGDAIALIGSTGRSTGPHVHFEVHRDGKIINPYNFVKS